MISIDRGILVLKALTILAAAILLWTTPTYFWDFQVYVDAVELYGRGEDPYFKQGYEYVYPPLTLPILQLVLNAVPHSVLLALNIAVYFYLPFILFKDKGKFLDSTLVIFGACGLIGLGAFITGNITATLYLIVFLLFLSFSNSHAREPLFALGVLFVSLFKPYYLAFVLLLPFLNKSIGRSVVIALAVASSVFLLIYSIEPFEGAFQSFLDALSRRTRGFTWDIGSSMSSILARATYTWIDIDAAALILAFHGIIFAPIVILFVVFRNQIFREKYLFFVISTAIILNPRLKIYDMCLLCFVIYAFYQNWFEDFRTSRIIDGIFIGTAAFIIPQTFGLKVQDLATAFIHIAYVAMAVMVTFELFEERAQLTDSTVNKAKH